MVYGRTIFHTDFQDKCNKISGGHTLSDCLCCQTYKTKQQQQDSRNLGCSGGKRNDLITSANFEKKKQATGRQPVDVVFCDRLNIPAPFSTGKRRA